MSLRRWILLSVLLGMLTGCGGPWDSGDRVLVTKSNDPVMNPERYHVVVFKYPQRPVEKGTPKNYIKRLLGLPGELIAIFFGRVYHRVPEGDKPFFDDLAAGVQPNDLWQSQYLHVTDEEGKNGHREFDEKGMTARKWFSEGKYTILRKPPKVMMALRRIVYDNDFQPKDLAGKLERWSPSPTSSWKTDKATGFVSDGKAADKIDWLRYQHLVRQDEIAGEARVPPAGIKKMLILDTLDYNSGLTEHQNDRQFFHNHYAMAHWVGDLMLECNLDVVEPKGEFCMELSRGIYRFQASFDLATGKCSLYRLGKDNQREEPPMAVQDTSIKSTGNYLVRFANIDARLTVWVDRSLPFGDGQDYDPPEVRGPKDKDLTDAELIARRGPTENDFEPASIGVSKGANVKVSHLRLWRDIYYRVTADPRESDHNLSMTRADWSQGSNQLATLRDKMRFVSMYVQPGHFLCLGDNSQASSDSRDWGLVPQRLMLGRALAVYYPIERMGPIR